MSDEISGTVITFYSYKGGAGRSMALANMAWILASNGKKVLVIDWDLEAPGLHRYFQPFLIDPELVSSEGVIDFVWNLAMTTVTPLTNSGQPDEAWVSDVADITSHAIRLEWDFGMTGVLDFIPSGQQGKYYTERVNKFNWEAFYKRLGGGRLLQAARKRMKQKYEYILIDSRTGVSDTSGICTIQMPDTVVACTTLNNQSLIGVSAVLESIRSQRKPEDLRIFPTIMRVELAEQTKLASARKTARHILSEFLPYFTESEKIKYWKDTEVLYYPYYAYEEVLATFGDNLEASKSDTSLLSTMERLGRHVTGISTLAMPVIDEDKRLRVIDRYARGEQVELEDGFLRKIVPTSTISSMDDRYDYDVFISYRRSGEWPRWVNDVFVPLFRHWLSEELGRDTMIFISDEGEVGLDWPKALRSALIKSRILVPLWTATYFSSNWCIAELAHMLYREKMCGYRNPDHPSGLIVPVILHGGANYPIVTNSIHALGLQEFANVRLARNSPTAEGLSSRIQQWVPQVASAIFAAPAWNAEWEHFPEAEIESSIATMRGSSNFLNPPRLT